MTRHLWIAFALWAALTAAADAQEFRHRGWVGARLEADADKGCAMGLDIRRGGGFVVYASGKPAFKIGVGSADWTLETGKEQMAAVTFDDGPPILLKGAAISPTTVLFEPFEFAGRGGLEPLVESARSIKLTTGGRFLRARLSGSARALKLLRECASAQEQPETAAAPGDPAPAAPDDRSVDFSFLRQGLDVAEANDRLLAAGWQADIPPDGADADPLVKALAARGVAAQACAGAPPACTIAYADAYGNALKVTVMGEGAAKVRGWRLNPPDAPARAADADEAPEDAAPRLD